jgi:putative ABC transport system permease protein
MISDFFSLAFKNLKHRGIRSWLTLLGIFIGVTAVVSLISLGNGLQIAVASQFGISANEFITVQAGGLSGYGPPGSNVVDPLEQSDVDAIERLSSVENAVRRNINSGKVGFNDIIQFRYIGSIPDNNEDRKMIYTNLDMEILKGRFLEDGDMGKVVVGYNFYAKEEDWGGKQLSVGKTISVNEENFEVIGITDKQGSLIMDNIIIMGENDMEKLFGFGDVADIIVVQPKNADEMQRTKTDVEKLLRNKRGVKEGEEDFEVSTPEAALSTVNSILGGVQIFIAIVASISIFIGAIGIVNTMTTSVLERKREIGIMKSIGAKNSHIFLQFFIESSLLGLIGGIIGALFGTIIGVAGTMGINGFLGTDLAPNVDIFLISFSLIGSFIIGGIAGIVPAMKAARQNPVEALRG